MNCINCNSDNVISSDDFTFSCKCGEVFSLKHHTCMTCVFSWKTLNNVPIEGVFISSDILPDFVSHDDINELIKQPEHRKFDISNKFISMINCIHRCLRCGAIAYEIEKNVFKCGDNTCGFKWEVLTFEE